MAAYGMCEGSGFLPSEAPIANLGHTYYQPWEAAIDSLQPDIQHETLRDRIDKMEVLYTHHLKDDGEWRRAYVILTFLAQGYTWAGRSPSEVRSPQETLVTVAVS